MRSLKALPSYFVGYAAFEALTALPGGVWDRYHMGQDDPPPESTRGYGEDRFEKEFDTIKEVYHSHLSSREGGAPQLDLSDPTDCFEAVFEEITGVLLGSKIHLLGNLRRSLHNVDYEKLTAHFVEQLTRVGFFVFKKRLFCITSNKGKSI